MNLSAITLTNGEKPWPGIDIPVERITSDSRRVSEGTIFAAWKGENSDGHAFISDAVSKGAVAVLCDDTHVESISVPVFRSRNVRRDYALIAYKLAGIEKNTLLLVGVTGTNGKTTTTQLIAQILRRLGNKVGTIGTLGAEIDGVVFREGMTTPPAEVAASDLARMRDSGVKICVMEVSSHALQQERLFGLSFDAGAWTNLTPEHLDFHGSMEAYAEAKARLFHEYCDDRSTWVMNVDDPTVAQFVEPKAFTFSLERSSQDSANLRVSEATFSKNMTKCRFVIDGTSYEIESPLIGEFNLANLAAAVGMVTRLGFPLSETLACIPKLSGIPGRMELVSRGDEPLVVVDYAHTADALLKALATLKALSHRRLICVFGCGGDRDKEKRPAMGEVVSKYADRFVITNDNPRTEDPQIIAEMIQIGIVENARSHYSICLDREAAIEDAINACAAEDIVLIAGKGHETYQIMGSTTLEFDDRKIARKYLDMKFSDSVN